MKMLRNGHEVTTMNRKYIKTLESSSVLQYLTDFNFISWYLIYKKIQETKDKLLTKDNNNIS